MNEKIMRGAEPFFIPRGRIGCVCIHGLSASPQEVYWLGTYLAERGVSVYGPRLYGHGLAVTHMQRGRWQDWYLSILDGFHLLRRHCDYVFAAGISTGGLLSLMLAANEPLDGAIGLATAFRLRGRNLSAAHLLRLFGTTVNKSGRDSDPIYQRVVAIQKERGEEITGRVAYYQHSAVGISELLKLQAEVAVSLSKITAPVLLIDSERDEVVPTGAADLLKQKLTASRDVQLLRLQQSGHILTNDVECDTVFEATWTFMKQVAPEETQEKQEHVM